MARLHAITNAPDGESRSCEGVGIPFAIRVRMVLLAALLLGSGVAKVVVPYSDKYYMPCWTYYSACAVELVLGMMVLLTKPRVEVIVLVTAGALVASALSLIIKEDCGCLPVTNVHAHELRTGVAALMAALGLWILRDMVRS